MLLVTIKNEHKTPSAIREIINFNRFFRLLYSQRLSAGWTADNGHGHERAADDTKAIFLVFAEEDEPPKIIFIHFVTTKR